MGVSTRRPAQIDGRRPNGRSTSGPIWTSLAGPIMPLLNLLALEERPAVDGAMAKEGSQQVPAPIDREWIGQALRRAFEVPISGSFIDLLESSGREHGSKGRGFLFGCSEAEAQSPRRRDAER
jgi:hypothetical protein